MEMQLDKQTLTVVVRNSEPVELSVFAQSMMSLADDYESMCGSAGSHARLYIKEIRQGSIIAELAPLLPLAGTLFEGAGQILAYAKNFIEITDWLMGKGKEPTGVTDSQIRNIANIMQPAASDKNGSLEINVNDNNGSVVNNITYNYFAANTVQNQARRILGERAEASESGDYGQMVMYFVQAAPTKETNQAVIEGIYGRPVKILIPEHIKREMFAEPYPFEKYYIVDVSVQTARGKPRLYKVTGYHGVVDGDD